MLHVLMFNQIYNIKKHTVEFIGGESQISNVPFHIQLIYGMPVPVLTNRIGQLLNVLSMDGGIANIAGALLYENCKITKPTNPENVPQT